MSNLKKEKIQLDKFQTCLICSFSALNSLKWNFSPSTFFLGKLFFSIDFTFFFNFQKSNPEEDPFVPTSEDLAGFWDMVYIQVEHIHSLFAELSTLRQNGWKRPEVRYFFFVIRYG